MTIGYPNDDGTITAAKDGDVLTVPDHNGKCIELLAQSTHKVPTVQTDNLMLNLINRLTTTMNFLRIMCCQKVILKKRH